MPPASVPAKSGPTLSKLAAVLVCLICFQVLGSASGLGRHWQATGHATGIPEINETEKELLKRTRYTFRQKRDYINAVRQVAAEECGGSFFAARKLVCRRTGVSAKNLYNWEQDAETIMRYAGTRLLYV